MNTDAYCPWESIGTVDLKGKILKVIEKKYLGEQIATGQQKVKELTTKYNINKRTVSDYKNKYIYHLRTCEEGGRPRCLDPEAQEFIIQTIRSDPSISESKLRQIIREKHKECWVQWNTYHVDRVYRKVSVRTVVRYSQLLRQRATSPTLLQATTTASTCVLC
jgi:transposase